MDSLPRRISAFLSILLMLLSPSLAEDPAFELGNETTTHLHFFFHDIVAGSNPTAVRIAQASATTSSPAAFGALMMMDDPLTEGPDAESKLVGRAQGVYGLASRDEPGHLLVTMTLAFVDGEYNGSTLAVLGRNSVFSAVREMPVVGGSGRFRLARGFALAKTHELDMTTGNA
ncbi:hypothetical protein B296_00052792, partial [Ensete ventricosum]